MSILRTSHNKGRPYAVMDKGAHEDTKLSWGAKGLWSYLMGRPDHWKVSITHLSSIYKERGGGEKAIYGFLKELIENGYCEREQIKDDKGLFCKTEYVIFEFKKCLPNRLEGDAVQRHAVKDGLVYNESKVSKETTNKEQPVVVQNYECLAKANLSKEDCKALMSYPENRVKLALSFIDNKKFEVKTTRIASLIWHCQQEIPPVHAETKEDFIAKKQSEADEIFERVAINKEKFKRLKIKHWNELAVKPWDNHELVEFDVNRIYFKDKDFDRLILKAFKDNKKEEITECENYDF